ncbi:MAG: ABC transporter permease [Candidatus Limnocylindrales bacterium]
MRPLLRSLMAKPWIWAYVAAVLVWLATVITTGGQATVGLLNAALTFGSFFTLVGIGQMYVITLGPGNVDLSIPTTMVLAATISIKTMDGDPAMIPIGLALTIAVGVLVGTANYALIRLLRIPPIIATLSSSFIILSVAIVWNRGLRIKPPELLGDFPGTDVFGIPLVALLVIAIAAVMHVVLERTRYGRSVTAIGQNPRAARLAGVPVDRTRFVAYVSSAILASLAGFLLASYSGGPALNMGDPYLLTSIAVVVIGGTAVTGGYGNVPGLWGASLFLFLLAAMLNTFGIGEGVRQVLTGVIVILVIVVASFRRAPD